MYNPKVYLTDSEINNQKNGPVVKNIFLWHYLLIC